MAGSPGLVLAAAGLAILAGVLALLAATVRVAPIPRERLDGIALLGAPVALWVTALSGGLRSPGAVVLALAALAAATGRRPRTAVLVAALALVALAGVHGLAVGVPTLPELVQGAVPLATLVVVPVWLAARAAPALAEARRRTQQLERVLGGRRPTPEVAQAALRLAGRGPVEVSSSRGAPTDSLQSLLRIVRDQSGGDDAVFFRFTRERDALEAKAWASDGVVGPLEVRTEWHRLIEWTARERLAQCDASDGSPVFAVAPVPGERAPLGALCVMGAGGLRLSRPELLEWLPRHATVLGRMADLLDARTRLGEETRRSGLVLDYVEKFQATASREELSRLVCEAALEISAVERVALVRWHRSADRGEVAGVLGEGVAPVGLVVDAESLVGEVCRGGLPLVWEDARAETRNRRLFGPSDSGAQIASLGIYPLKNHDKHTVGALVVQGTSPGIVRYHAMRDLKLLSLYAAGSLETVWKIAEVSQQASTDALTGLNNRRTFDEQLAKEYARIGRHASPLSLIVADIDHFKRVNDTHGHEAGDAVLRAVAKLFQDTVRETDLTARYGGEEIVVLLPDTPLSGAVGLAERLRRALESRPVKVPGGEIPVTASFGVACVPETARSSDELFQSADRALYEAKHEGRNRVKSAKPTSATERT